MRSLALIAFLVPIGTPASAAASPISLVCEVQKTYDTKTKIMSPTSGSNTYVFDEKDDGSWSLNLPFPCQTTTSFHATETEFYVACEYQLNDKPPTFSQSATIDRYSGEYTNTLATKGADATLIHHGICKLSTRKF